ncbi:MAG: membrane protein insertase YidC [Bdellovibrionales bacterium]|nr:membrane protein insertase YidC [Bdellovibrionales bacterium]
MNNQNGPGSFFDTKTLIALSITFLAWIGWQWHLQKKYPQMNKEKAVEAKTESSPIKDPLAQDQKNKVITIENKDEIKTPAEIEKRAETLFPVEDENWKFSLSSVGMSLKSLELKKFTDRESQPIKIGMDGAGFFPLETKFIGQTDELFFDIQKITETRFVGSAQLQGIKIIKTIELNSREYRIDTQISLSGQFDIYRGISTYLVEPLHKIASSGFLSPPAEHQEVYFLSQDSTERKHPKSESEEVYAANKIKVVAIGSQYFTQAVLDSSEVLPDVSVKVSPKEGTIVGTMNFNFIPGQKSLNLKHIAVFGPKDLTLLKEISEDLMGLVDFGFFAVLGRPILKMLKWFFALVGNWGVAIILLTVLVRFLVLPFNVMSFRSMKAMQKVQPQMQAIREKFKDSKEKQNHEMMVLFRENKINPLGGCLPVLLQIPIFFALYQVLGHSIELYKAPFMFWIHDLSAKDPYFVLPVFMGVTMFLQQKLTPTTMDPAQAKILMFMPIIFSIFMLTLPSGLTLYIFISTLFGIGQQLYLMQGSQPEKSLKN